MKTKMQTEYILMICDGDTLVKYAPVGKETYTKAIKTRMWQTMKGSQFIKGIFSEKLKEIYDNEPDVQTFKAKFLLVN